MHFFRVCWNNLVSLRITFEHFVFYSIVEKLKTLHAETGLYKLLIGLQLATIADDSAFVVCYSLIWLQSAPQYHFPPLTQCSQLSAHRTVLTLLIMVFPKALYWGPSLLILHESIAGNLFVIDLQTYLSAYFSTCCWTVSEIMRQRCTSFILAQKKKQKQSEHCFVLTVGYS